MGEMPFVSIIIPVYNGADYLEECIESALDQTYPHIEVIVVNDGSDDNGATEAVALSYGDRIRYFRKENGGVSSALNLGIRRMKGDYFSWLSHDDLYLPEKVAVQVEAVMRFPEETVMAVCLAGQINRLSQSIREAKPLPLTADRIIPADEALKEYLRLGQFNGCALLIPKTILDACGGFDESLRYCQDYLMWAEIFMHGCALIYVPFHGVQMRVHEQQFTYRGRDLYFKENLMICERILPYLLSHSTPSRNYLYEFAYSSGVHNNATTVRRCLSEGKARGILTLGQRLSLRWVLFYGRIRPFLRRCYYRVFRRVKV